MMTAALAIAAGLLLIGVVILTWIDQHRPQPPHVGLVIFEVDWVAEIEHAIRSTTDRDEQDQLLDLWARETGRAE